jgi:hypothetical protein
MPKNKKWEIISVSLLVLGLIFLLPNMEDSKSFILGFISLLSGTLGSIFSIFIPKKYVYMFKEKDWKNTKVEHEWFLSIPSEKHGMGKSPKIESFQKNNFNYEAVGCYGSHDNEGNVEVGASINFEGKLIIS